MPESFDLSQISPVTRLQMVLKAGNPFRWGYREVKIQVFENGQVANEPFMQVFENA
jgi:hypothetical protein